MFKSFTHWDVVLLLSLMAALTAVELMGVFSPRLITITQIVKDFIPIPVRIMILAWLNWHFCLSDLVRQLTPKT
jgi:hypothetical protein